jgi:hypothetical protein
MLECLKDYEKRIMVTPMFFMVLEKATKAYNVSIPRRKAMPHAYDSSRVMMQAEIDTLDAIGLQCFP